MMQFLPFIPRMSVWTVYLLTNVVCLQVKNSLACVTFQHIFKIWLFLFIERGMILFSVSVFACLFMFFQMSTLYMSACFNLQCFFSAASNYMSAEEEEEEEEEEGLNGLF